jgi:hypothetical protein
VNECWMFSASHLTRLLAGVAGLCVLSPPSRASSLIGGKLTAARVSLPPCIPPGGPQGINWTRVQIDLIDIDLYPMSIRTIFA